jgi:hypothetical protein
MKTSIHEAGHAIERYLVHGSTGAVRPEPAEGKQAGAESEPLPESLRETAANSPSGERLRDGPYSEDERARLIQQVKTTLAGSVAEGIGQGREPLDVLEDGEQRSDACEVWGIAKRLWPEAFQDEVAALADEVEADLNRAWPWLTRVAEAYEGHSGLAADDVAKLLSDMPG